MTNGIRTMPAYESQIPVADRWAIVGYVEALQRSQNAKEDDVPAAERSNLPVIKRELPPVEDEAAENAAAEEPQS